MFNEKFPLEKFIQSQLIKHKHNVDQVIKSVSNQYPFIKKNDLRSMISAIILKKVNHERISGFWRKINNKWNMVNGAGDGSQASGYSWSGPELPASADESSLGSARNTYSQLGDRPSGTSPRTTEREVKNIMEVEDDGTGSEVQKLYDKLMYDYASFVDGVEERSEVVLEELKERGFNVDKVVQKEK